MTPSKQLFQSGKLKKVPERRDEPRGAYAEREKL